MGHDLFYDDVDLPPQEPATLDLAPSTPSGSAAIGGSAGDAVRASAACSSIACASGACAACGSAADLELPGLTSGLVAQLVTSARLVQAQHLVNNRSICSFRRSAGGLASATVLGGQRYTVELKHTDVANPEVLCTCPDYIQRQALCKHGAAFLLVLVPGTNYVYSPSGLLAPPCVGVKKEDPVVKEEFPTGVGHELKAKEESGIRVKTEKVADASPPLPPPVESPPKMLSRISENVDESNLKISLGTSCDGLKPSASQVPRRRRLPDSFAKAIEDLDNRVCPASSRSNSKALPSGEAPLAEGICGAEVRPPPAKRARQSPQRPRAVDGASRGGSAKPLSAYQLYLRATKSFGVGDTGVKWKDLSAEERRPYEEQAREERLKFEAECRQDPASASGMEERTVSSRPFGFASDQPIPAEASTSQPNGSRSKEPMQLCEKAGNTGRPSAQSDHCASWACTTCTFENNGMLSACEMCDAARPTSSASSSAPPPSAAPVTKAGKRPWPSADGMSARLDHLMFEDSQEDAPSTATTLAKHPRDGSTAVVAPPPGPSSSSGTIAPPLGGRMRCKYGDKCYRKNPEHRSSFSHPGDRDWDGELTAGASGKSASAETMSVSAALQVAAAVGARNLSQSGLPHNVGEPRVSPQRSPPLPSVGLASGIKPITTAAPAPSAASPIRTTLVVPTGASDASDACATPKSSSRDAEPLAARQVPLEQPPLDAVQTPPAVRMSSSTAPALENYGRPVMSFLDKLKELDD